MKNYPVGKELNEDILDFCEIRVCFIFEDNVEDAICFDVSYINMGESFQILILNSGF